MEIIINCGSRFKNDNILPTEVSRVSLWTDCYVKDDMKFG